MVFHDNSLNQRSVDSWMECNRTNCFCHLDADIQREIFAKREQALSHLLFQTYGCIAAPLSVFGLLLTVAYICAVRKVITTRRASRKFYFLLLNRAIGDTLCCVSSICVGVYTFMTSKVNGDVVTMADTVFVSCFWSATTSYVSLSFLKFYAIWKPFEHREMFTMKRCAHLIIFSWFVFALVIAYALMMIALVKVRSLNQWSGCKAETCLRFMFLSRNLLAVILYVLTIGVFGFTYLLLHRSRKFIDSFRRENNNDGNQSQCSRFPFWKLTLNVATFAGFNFLYVAFTVFMLLQERCFFQRHFVMMRSILGYIRCTLLMRIIADAVISFITDTHIRVIAESWFGVEKHHSISSISCGTKITITSGTVSPSIQQKETTFNGNMVKQSHSIG